MAAAAVPVALPAAPAQAADDWNPPAGPVQPLGEVWNHVESTYPDLYGFRTYGWDQIMANRGSVNYCVRWDSDAPEEAVRHHGDYSRCPGGAPRHYDQSPWLTMGRAAPRRSPSSTSGCSATSGGT